MHRFYNINNNVNITNYIDLQLLRQSVRIKSYVIQRFIIFSGFGIIEIKPNVPVFEIAVMHACNALHLG